MSRATTIGECPGSRTPPSRAELVDDFTRWLTESKYGATPLRVFPQDVRRVLEADRERRPHGTYGTDELARMFAARTSQSSPRRAKAAFEAFLAARGLLELRSPEGPFQALLSGYRRYLREVRGLTPDTIKISARIAERFCRDVAAAPEALQLLQRSAVEAFVDAECAGSTRGHRLNVAAKVRGFLKYCHLKGLCPDGLGVLDTPRNYRLERPPRAIPWHLVQQLLESIDRSTQMGCRDHAMLYLMAHYGLRPIEVCELRVRDVDFKRRRISVRQSKTRSTLELPLNKPALAVIREYLKAGRPESTHPNLFLSAAAPVGPITRNAISNRFTTIKHESGLPLANAVLYGLRHGFAMRLLENDVGLKAIGDLLGHRTIEATCVYLRLDMKSLRSVGLPVPT